MHTLYNTEEHVVLAPALYQLGMSNLGADRLYLSSSKQYHNKSHIIKDGDRKVFFSQPVQLPELLCHQK